MDTASDVGWTYRPDWFLTDATGKLRCLAYAYSTYVIAPSPYDAATQLATPSDCGCALPPDGTGKSEVMPVFQMSPTIVDR